MLIKELAKLVPLGNFNPFAQDGAKKKTTKSEAIVKTATYIRSSFESKNIHFAVHELTKDAAVNGLWVYYDRRWQPITKVNLQALLFEICSICPALVKFWDDKHFLQELSEQIANCRIRSFPADNLNLNHVYFANGVLCVDVQSATFTFEDHSPNLFNTAVLDYDFEPTADCPRFQQFLQEIMDNEQVETVLDYFASCFFSHEQLRHERVLWVSGSGANGKSVLLNTFMSLFSKDEYTTIDLNTLTSDDKYRAEFVNKRFNCCTDSQVRCNEAMFKTIASGDSISYRRLYQSPAKSTNYGRIIISTNDIPFGDNSSSFYRRLIPINLTRSFEHNGDIQLQAKLKQERAGIMNLILKHVVKLAKSKSLDVSSAIQRQLIEMKSESSLFQMFIDEHYIVASAISPMRNQDLYERFRIFCERQGVKPLSQRWLGLQMKQHGFRQVQTHEGRAWQIRFSPEEFAKLRQQQESSVVSDKPKFTVPNELAITDKRTNYYRRSNKQNRTEVVEATVVTEPVKSQLPEPTVTQSSESEDEFANINIADLILTPESKLSPVVEEFMRMIESRRQTEVEIPSDAVKASGLSPTHSNSIDSVKARYAKVVDVSKLSKLKQSVESSNITSNINGNGYLNHMEDEEQPPLPDINDCQIYCQTYYDNFGQSEPIICPF